MNAQAIIVAAGRGSRFGSDMPKQFLELGGKPILAHAAAAFEAHPAIESVVIVGAEDWLFYIAEDIVGKYGLTKVQKIVSGGKERQDSVAAGLAALEKTDTPVLIHDGARPLVPAAVIDRVLAGMSGADACIPAVPLHDTIKQVRGREVLKTIDRDSLRAVQTPQGFWPRSLTELMRKAQEDALLVTDEAGLTEHYGGRVHWVDGDPANLKITTTFDLKIAQLILEE